MTETPCFIEPQSGNRYPLRVPRWCSDDGKPLMVTPGPGIGRADVDFRSRSLWRYRAALPCDLHAVSLGEGGTPMLEKTRRKQSVLYKLEWLSPTGSFKDKGAAVLVSYLKMFGVTEFMEDSSGNGGAAMAAYAAAAGIKAHILTPDSTSPAKLAQMRIFGATVHLVPGARENSESEAIKRSSHTFYASHNWHPFFLEGTKLTAYEIWEDLGFRAPDNVVVPVGAGSNALGCGIGFNELLQSGMISKRPRIFGVQPRNCGPIAAAYAADADRPVVQSFMPTAASGASIKRPVRGREVLAFVRQSGGAMLSVSEEEIKRATRHMAEGGLFIEPTSALAPAGFDRLVDAGLITSNELTVILLSGTGLKALEQVRELMPDERGRERNGSD